MSYMKNAMIEAWEAGAVPVEIEEVRAWRAAGHVVPLVWVAVDCFDGAKRRMPAIAVETAERLAGSLEDEQAREGLAAALEDCRGYLGIIGRRCAACGEACRTSRYELVTTTRAPAARRHPGA